MAISDRFEPNEETLREYRELERRQGAITEQLTGLRETKSTTSDGRHIVLSANIELPDEVEAVLSNGAEGVGLYRTEFLYLNQRSGRLRRSNSPFITVSRKASRPIRRSFALSISAVRNSRRASRPATKTPFLGWRAIRLLSREH